MKNQCRLDLLRKSDGWKAGVDGSVALATLGASGEISTDTIKEPIIGFIFSNKGLMYNLTFEGSKLTSLPEGERKHVPPFSFRDTEG